MAVTARWNGHTYGATFADYRGDLEPNVWMVFPTTITWTLDGKPLADLKVTFFRPLGVPRQNVPGRIVQQDQ